MYYQKLIRQVIMYDNGYISSDRSGTLDRCGGVVRVDG